MIRVGAMINDNLLDQFSTTDRNHDDEGSEFRDVITVLADECHHFRDTSPPRWLTIGSVMKNQSNSKRGRKDDKQKSLTMGL